ncbi:MAG: pyridoxine 5'-phosphate synthase [Planctomycetota bacterium]|jgi:pyridoxine 5-phosphate synthase
MPKLGVNIDHVATIREARKTIEPDPVWAAAVAELAGADQITCHLREDRRHIGDRDVETLRQTVRSKLNLEMCVGEEIVGIALKVKPEQATIVPEKREEVTTEGGLDARGNLARVTEVTSRLKGAGIIVSLFIDPEPDQIAASKEAGADAVELHTGRYAEASLRSTAGEEAAARLAELSKGVRAAREADLACHAGHGLTYLNVVPVARLEGIEELNIGHSIVARAVMVGLDRAVREMKELIA